MHVSPRPVLSALLLGAAAVLAACGLQVASPDLFVLQRTGAGQRLRLLVNDGGTIRCNGGRSRPLPDQLLIDARQLAADLGKDAQAKMRLPSPAGSVYRYVVTLQQGTVAFPDTAASRHPELARAQLFVVQALQQACRNSG